MESKGTVSLEGMEFFARHGVYNFERENGNTFLVDIHLSAFYRNDELYSLDNTFDYEKVYALAEKIMQHPEALLETVAHKIAIVLQSNFAGLQSIRIKICKLHPPIQNAVIRNSAFELEWNKGQ